MDGRFLTGDIVYWCEDKGNGRFEVAWGMVDEEYYDKVGVDLLEIRERRRINGIPLGEFKDEKWHKLPKGWTYTTQLFKLTYDSLEDGWGGVRPKDVMVDDPESLKGAYSAGLLVKARDIFHGDIEAEITKEGYRVVLKHPMWKPHPTYRGVDKRLLRRTYAGAWEDVSRETAEFMRQCSLSDEEWSKEQIEKTLARYALCLGAAADSPEVERARAYLMGLKRIEDVETRIHGGRMQWKYEGKKRWVDV